MSSRYRHPITLRRNWSENLFLDGCLSCLLSRARKHKPLCAQLAWLVPRRLTQPCPHARAPRPLLTFCSGSTNSCQPRFLHTSTQGPSSWEESHGALHKGPRSCTPPRRNLPRPVPAQRERVLVPCHQVLSTGVQTPQRHVRACQCTAPTRCVRLYACLYAACLACCAGCCTSSRRTS